MGKKRKPVNGSDQKSYERTQYHGHETFDNSEDEFFTGRDKILLDEGPAQKRRRKIEIEDQSLQPSDEEVLAYDDDGSANSEHDSSENAESGAAVEFAGEEDGEDDARDWGTSKADYYDADIIETEADAWEEEAEAHRLQQKRLQGMTEADFGLEALSWSLTDDKLGQEGRRVVEKLPDVIIPENISEQEKTQLLKNRYPEFEPLGRDFNQLQNDYRVLHKAAKAADFPLHQELTLENGRCPNAEDARPGPLAVTKFRAVSAYLGAIAMYFALLSTSRNPQQEQISAMPPAKLREHPVMHMILKCRKLWEKWKDVQEPEVETLALEDDIPMVRPVRQISDAPTETRPPTIREVPRTKRVQTSKDEIKGQMPVPGEVMPTEAKKKRNQRHNDLERLLAYADRTEVCDPKDTESEFGDEKPLTAEEAAEKARRKKSLRFYTSQIAQKSNKRGAASRDAGGDDDLPHKERLKDRQARLLREAEKRGRQAPDRQEQLDNEDVAHVRDETSDDYYDMVATKSKQKKAEKQSRADAHAEAARQGGEVYVEDSVGPDGKRAITYAISKNKGLAPKRKKEVRNPRVKKRKKYDEKMKKLGSIRQVYKGGESRGGYGGELTGIKMNLVKSVKL